MLRKHPVKVYEEDNVFSISARCERRVCKMGDV